MAHLFQTFATMKEQKSLLMWFVLWYQSKRVLQVSLPVTTPSPGSIAQNNGLGRGWFWTLRIPRRHSRSFLNMLIFIFFFSPCFAGFWLSEPLHFPFLLSGLPKHSQVWPEASADKRTTSLVEPWSHADLKSATSDFLGPLPIYCKAEPTGHQNNLWTWSQWDKLSKKLLPTVITVSGKTNNSFFKKLDSRGRRNSNHNYQR